jgi:hypothetical protein
MQKTSIVSRYVLTARIASLFLQIGCTGMLAAGSLAAQTDPAGSAPMRGDRAAHEILLQRDSAASYTPIKFHRQIQSAVALAGRYFDRGLSMHYAYRRVESVQAFRDAQRVDPRCVMCAVGEAIALGPTVDAPMDSASNAQALRALRRAQSLIARGEGSVSDAEWVRAVSQRYAANAVAARDAYDSAYATAMARLADASPEDADAQTLAAEASMILSPRTYWSESGEARPGTLHVVARLQHAMQLAPGHQGACYLFVHLMESVNPHASCGGRVSARR